MGKVFTFIKISISLVFCSPLVGSIDDYFPYQTFPTPSNYGNTGLMEIPTARFLEEGSLRFSFSSSYPNEFTSITASPFSWMEATYRYAEVKNELYGPTSYSGNQSLKDKGFDIKIKVLEESFFIPSLAIGLRDIAGTGFFSSEYFVATKSYGAVDLTAGLGWGLLGSDDNVTNPFNLLNDSFKDRESQTELGGNFNFKDWFSGKTAIFGGVEYYLKKHGLSFSLEYDSSRPELNFSNPVEVKSKVNLGINFFPSQNLHVGVHFERGTQFRLSFSLKGNFIEDTLSKPKPKNVVKLNKDQINRTLEDRNIFYRSLNKSLQDEKIFIQAAALNPEKVEISIASAKFNSLPRLVGRAARITSALLSEEVESINIHVMNGDLPVSIIELPRNEFDQANSSIGSSSELLANSQISSKSSKPLYLSSEFKPTINFPEFNWSMTPALRHQIGGPEGFYLGQLWWKTDLTLKLRRNLTLYSTFGLNIYDTFNDFKNDSLSKLPHVRSDIQKYLSEGKNNIQRFQLEYMFSPFDDIFIRTDFGMLEEMFGGYGGEVLYRPFNKKYSVGASLHRVKQRDYDQKLRFRDYTTTTGHLSIYYDFPYDISTQLSMGKYLAGDTGATLDLSRRFNSGFSLGIFASKTNLSAEEFGEGSFDKGFYFAIPIALFYNDYRTGSIAFGMHPLTKDGAAKLNSHNSLFSILADTNSNNILRRWKDITD